METHEEVKVQLLNSIALSLPLSLIKHYAMKPYLGVVHIQVLSVPNFDTRYRWPALCPSCFNPRESALGALWTESLAGQISGPLPPEIKTRFSGRPVLILVTIWVRTELSRLVHCFNSELKLSVNLN